MSYLQRYSGMTATELADEAKVLFDKVAMFPKGEIALIELRNIVPFLIDHLRNQAAALDGLVMIPEIDLQDMARLAAQQGRD